MARFRLAILLMLLPIALAAQTSVRYRDIPLGESVKTTGFPSPFRKKSADLDVNKGYSDSRSNAFFHLQIRYISVTFSVF